MICRKYPDTEAAVHTIQVYLKQTTPPPVVAANLGAAASSFPGSGGTIVKPEKQAAKAQRESLFVAQHTVISRAA